MKARELSSESVVYLSSVASICVNKSVLMHHRTKLKPKSSGDNQIKPTYKNENEMNENKKRYCFYIDPTTLNQVIFVPTCLQMRRF